MRSQKMLGTVMLLLCALVWGCSFTAQSVGMDYVGPFTLQATRLLLGSAVLAPIVLWRAARKKAAGVETTALERKNSLLGGACCGVVLCIAANLQQVGMQYTTVGKAAFITAMYVLLVPVISVLLGKKIGRRVIVAVAMGVVGLYLLCMQDGGFSLGQGDSIVMLCAVAFAGHIMAVDHFSARVDGVLLSCLQFLVAGVLSLIPMFMLEQLSAQALLDCWLPIGYMGVMSCGVAYTLQILGQKYVSPTAASLLMSMESVFSVLCGIVVLHQIPSAREAAGCVVMMAAILLCQLPERKKA